MDTPHRRPCSARCIPSPRLAVCGGSRTTVQRAKADGHPPTPCPGTEPRALARHGQSTGLSVSGLSPPGRAARDPPPLLPWEGARRPWPATALVFDGRRQSPSPAEDSGCPSPEVKEEPAAAGRWRGTWRGRAPAGLGLRHDGKSQMRDVDCPQRAEHGQSLPARFPSDRTRFPVRGDGRVDDRPDGQLDGEGNGGDLRRWTGGRCGRRMCPNRTHDLKAPR
jgi:hypothetical protein